MSRIRPDVKWPPNDRNGLCPLVALAILAVLGAGVWAVIYASIALVKALST